MQLRRLLAIIAAIIIILVVASAWIWLKIRKAYKPLTQPVETAYIIAKLP